MVIDSQKKLEIIKRYKDKWTTRRTAEELHVSLRDISDTIKEYVQAKQLLMATGDIPEASGHSKLPTKSTIVDAFKLFEREPSLVKNLIHLKLEDPEQLRKWFADYVDLNGKGKCLELCDKVGSQRILAVAETIARREEKGISDEEYLEGLETERDVVQLRKDVQEFRNEKAILEKQLPPLRVESATLKEELPELRGQKSALEDMVDKMEEFHDIISNLIWEIEHGEGYQKAVELIENVTGGLLNSRMFGERALIAVRNAIRRDPEKLELLFTVPTNPLYSGLTENFPVEFQPLARTMADEINKNEAKSIGRESLAEASREIRSYIRPR